MLESKTFCSFPWVHLFVDPLGYFYTCCVGPASVTPSNHESKVLKAGEPNAILNHWNSSYMQAIRSSLNNGEQHSACVACWRVENVGDLSYRHSANLGYKVSEELRETNLPPPSFKFVDLRFGNLCNLACRMCLPYTSRKLIPEYSEMFGSESTKPYTNLTWFESEIFWEELLKYSSSIERIHLAGGEPLLIKQCWSFLKKLVESGKSKELVLSYNTNLTILPPDLKEIWSKFKEVHAFISMDGVKEVNEFIRYPLKWDSFERNMLELDENYDSYNLKYCQIHATAQVYNIMRVDEICDYVAKFKKFRRIPKIDIVFGPEHFDPLVLPDAYRFEAADKIDKYIEKLSAGHNGLSIGDRNELIQNIKSISTHLRGKMKEGVFHTFKRHNDIYDRHRNQKTFDFIPELKKAF